MRILVKPAFRLSLAFSCCSGVGNRSNKPVNKHKSEKNQCEALYVINPKEETYKAYALMTYRLQRKRITYSLTRDYIPILRIG